MRRVPTPSVLFVMCGARHSHVTLCSKASLQALLHSLHQLATLAPWVLQQLCCVPVLDLRVWIARRGISARLEQWHGEGARHWWFTMLARMGVKSPSRLSRPFTIAAAVISTRPSLDE